MHAVIVKAKLKEMSSVSNAINSPIVILTHFGKSSFIFFSPFKSLAQLYLLSSGANPIMMSHAP